MQSQIVRISSKKYVAGLFWQPVSAVRNARNYAKHLAKSIGNRTNLFVEYRAMVGLGSRRHEHRIGQPSIAAEVMEAFSEYSSFLAAFELGHQTLIIASRNGVFICDRLFSDETIAKQEYANLANLPDWGALIAPMPWNVPRAVEKHIDEIITGSRKYKLKNISRWPDNLFALILFAAFAIVLAYFLKGALQKQIAPVKLDPVIAAEYKVRLEEKNKELDKQFQIEKAAPEPIVLQPYETLPDPTAHAVICMQAIGFLMQSIPGWDQTDAVCTDGYASAILRRTFGTLADFYAIGDRIMRGVAAEERSDSEILISAALPPLETFSSLSELDSASAAREANSLFQQAGMSADIAVQDGFIGIAADSKLVPAEFIKIFSEFEGVSLESVRWNAARKTWSYEVRIYVKN